MLMEKAFLDLGLDGITSVEWPGLLDGWEDEIVVAGCHQPSDFPITSFNDSPPSSLGELFV